MATSDVSLVPTALLFPSCPRFLPPSLLSLSSLPSSLGYCYPDITLPPNLLPLPLLSPFSSHNRPNLPWQWATDAIMIIRSSYGFSVRARAQNPEKLQRLTSQLLINHQKLTNCLPLGIVEKALFSVITGYNGLDVSEENWAEFAAKYAHLSIYLAIHERANEIDSDRIWKSTTSLDDCWTPPDATSYHWATYSSERLPRV